MRAECYSGRVRRTLSIMQDHAGGARVLMQPASRGSLRSLGAAARAAPLRLGREAGTSLQAPRMLVEAQSAAAASGPGFRGSFLKWQPWPCSSFRLLRVRVVESDRPHGRFVMHRTR